MTRRVQAPAKEARENAPAHLHRYYDCFSNANFDFLRDRPRNKISYPSMGITRLIMHLYISLTPKRRMHSVGDPVIFQSAPLEEKQRIIVRNEFRLSIPNLYLRIPGESRARCDPEGALCGPRMQEEVRREAGE